MKKQLFLLLPNLRSGWNTGAFFRVADALGVERIFLTGHTPYPPHQEIAKTALGAEHSVPWEFHLGSNCILQKLRKQGVQIVALENLPQAKALEDFQTRAQKICLVVGNEISGVSNKILQLADQILRIGMRGQKESLNVATAGAIALWHLCQK